MSSSTPEPIVVADPRLSATLRQAATMKVIAEFAKTGDRTTRDTTIDELLVAYRESGQKSFRVDGYGLEGIATITLADNNSAAEVVDEEIFADWVEEHYPTEVEYITQVKKAWLTSFLKALTITDDGAVHAVLGSVPGVGVRKGGDPKKYTVTLNKDALPAVTEKVIEGAVEHLAAITGPAQVEAGK